MKREAAREQAKDRPKERDSWSFGKGNAQLKLNLEKSNTWGLKRFCYLMYCTLPVIHCNQSPQNLVA